MRFSFRTWVFATLIALPSFAMARASIATVPNHVETTYVAWNAADQAAADRAAIMGCRELAKASRLASGGTDCIVIHRQLGPGFGATSCGARGCEWATGYQHKQSAFDVAYAVCDAKQTGTCAEPSMVWEDRLGYGDEPVCKGKSGQRCK